MKQSTDKAANDSAEKKIATSLPPLSGENLQQFIELAPLPVFVADLDDNFVFGNSAVCRFLGYTIEELTDKKFADVIRPEKSSRLANLKQQVADDRQERGDWEFLRKDGKRVWGEVSSRLLSGGRRLVFVSDITERKQAEQSLLESEEKRLQWQKIEALGRLAGGIAHDFNNFLAVILLHLDMLSLQLSADSPLRYRVDEIKAVSDNAAAIIRQLLAFGRKQPMSPAPAALNQVVSEFSKNLPALLGEEIQAELNLEPDLGICFIDRNQIVQVLQNLAINAKDAMPDGGVFKIETANVVLDKHANHKSQSGGSYIQITVSDNGSGMDSETQDHIFEPFFSTKESDKGAGLGLATVYGIVKQSGGFIWVESKMNQGTTFKIQFPRIDEPLITAAQPKTVAPPSPTENKVVLLVEDEAAVRRITAEFLKLSDYEVLEAASGMEALEIAQSYNKPIHLLLTDFSMPQMNGREVAAKIKSIHPETAVLLMSGNVGNIIFGQGDSPEKINLIGKPFSPSELTLKIEEMLKS